MDAFDGLAGNTFTPVRINNYYHEAISYDPNGNIQTYLRQGDSRSTGMDDLSYHYTPNTNQLNHVTDAVVTPTPADYNDLKTQSVNNYTYDQIGDLTSDLSEGISDIAWTVYGKIKSILKSNGTLIKYAYDAAGNRLSKIVTTSTTGDSTYYVRDASGNVMSVYNKKGALNLFQTELHFYGSSRLGVYNVNVDVQNCSAITGLVTTFTRGNKFFELSNHLGNVLAAVSDKKLQASLDGHFVSYYNADVVTANDYYPFGALMPGRRFAVGGRSYRYGFNGKEKSDEVYGEGNIYDYGFRIYNPRVGRFLSLDPLTKSYPWFTPYQFAGNSPITFVDLEGLEMGWKNPQTGEVKGAGPIGLPVGSVNDNGWVLFAPAIAKMQPLQKAVSAKKIKIDIAADATIVTQIHKVIPVQKQREQEILAADIFGNGHIGPKSVVESNIAAIKQNYYNAIAENIAGGPGGAAGYMIGGDRGSFYGSVVDQIGISFAGIPGRSSVLSKPANITISKFVPYTEKSLFNQSGGAVRASKFSNDWKSASLIEVIKGFGASQVGGITQSGKAIYRNSQTGIDIIADQSGNYFRIQDNKIIGTRCFLSLDGSNPTNSVENGRTTGRSKSEYQQLTHFNNSDHQ